MAIKKSRRSGVALIIVLGLVAILMIVSVAFTIHMRVERAGAANLRHAAIARQIVKGGLAAALMAIDRQAGESAVPEWYEKGDVTSLTYNPFSKSNRVKGYLWRDTFISFDTNDTDNVTTRKNQHTYNKEVSGTLNATIFSEEVEKYFPAGLAYRGYATAYSPTNNTDGTKWRPIIQPQWQPVFADADNDNVMGRYAFFILDTTGMLDASCMASSANSRWMGRDPSEMDVSLLPDVEDATKFAEANSKNGTYETLAEFAALTGDDTAPENYSFNTFSEDPGPTNELVYIGGSATEIQENKDAIIEAFYDCGLTAGESYGPKDCEQARWAYLGLVDYVDDDGKMEPDDKIKPWERPATENMPLVSGFFAKLTVRAEHKQTWQRADKNSPWTVKDMTKPVAIQFKADVRVPFVYPFTSEVDSQATLKGKATIRVNGRIHNLFNPDDGHELSRREINDLWENGSQSKSMKSDFILDDIAVDYTKAVSIAAESSPDPNNRNSVANQLKLAKVGATLQVGGATYFGSALQHCFPAVDGEFSNDDTPLTDGYGMFVQISGGTDVAFSEDAPTESGEPPADLAEDTVWTGARVWETNILVWAEIVDPRFSCKPLADSPDDADIVRTCFKASHVESASEEEGHQAVSLCHLKTTFRDAFGAFNDAEKFAGMPLNDAWDKNRQPAGSLFGWYFGWSEGEETQPGTGPFAAYLLEHPKAVEELYNIPMDGIQKGASKSDSAPMMFRMHVANAPLQSVGELGYLPIGFWQTIRLYDYDDDFGASPGGRDEKTDFRIHPFNKIPEDADGGYFHPVLDYFTVVPEDELVRGRVNLNTLNKHILATVFHKMPVWTEGGDFSSTPTETRGRIDGRAQHQTDSVDLLAQAIIDYRNEAGSFTRLSELGYLFAGELTGNGKSWPAEAASNAAGGDALLGEFEREAIIRNSCGLFTLRGQTFIVVVKGESYSPPFGRKKQLSGGTSNSSKTAIAEVWRDSIPDDKGNYPMYVKFFKIIDD